MTSRLLARGSLRFYRRHRWQAALIVAGIALGVAVVVAVDMANESARRALALSVEAVAGGSTHRIVGGPAGVPQTLITDLRLELGIQRSAPVISDYVSLQERTLTLLGIDPLSEIALGRGRSPGTEGGGAPAMLLAEGIFLPRDTAAELGVAVSDNLEVLYRGRTLAVPLTGLLSGPGKGARNPGEEAAGLALGDIATVQVLLERGEKLDRIDLVLEPEQAARVAAWLPPGLTLVESETRNRTLKGMTETFHLNLTAMSLLALLVGGLLIYNTITFAVLQRARTWGIVRGLGASPADVAAVVLAEALVLGILGTALGLVAGTLLASGLVQLVLRTVDDLYFVLTVTQFHIDPLSLAKGVLLGVGVSAVSALVPAARVARMPAAVAVRRSALEGASRVRAPRWFLGGVAILAAGSWLAAGEERSLAAGFAALALQVAGFCAMVPVLVAAAVWTVKRTGDPLLGPVSRLALVGVSAGLSRTGMAVAALAVAVAATVGMGIMVTSFRYSLETWLGQTLSGDLYVSSRGGEGLPREFIAGVEMLSGVAGLVLSRQASVESSLGALELTAVGTRGTGVLAALSAPLLLERSDPGIARVFGRGEGVLVSEPLARHRGLAPGDSISFSTLEGAVALPVLGVFRDYRSSRGTAMIGLERYRELWNDVAVSGLAVHLQEGADGVRVAERISVLAAAVPAVEVNASGAIRQRSLEVFEQTFAVTRALRLMTVVVAFVGVFGALMLLQLERLRQLAILRATGMTAAEVAALALGQSAIMGVLAGLLAIPLGLLMAQVLIHVINVRAFGWTLATHIPAGVFAEALGLATAAALIAGVYPAWRCARVEPARVLRDE